MKNEKFNVINFHLTEKCNYSCKYCFAKFKVEKELCLSEWKDVVDAVNNYFIRNEIKDGRINLAGGEPLLVNYLDDLIDYINDKSIKVSIITNASLITKHHIDKWIGKVDMIGVSIDSTDQKTNQLIGRCTRSGQVNNIDNIISILEYAKDRYYLLKVNTVVSKLNIDENLSELYRKIKFDRIKLLQMRVNYQCNEESSKYAISKEEFQVYCDNISHTKGIIIEPEYDLECSYIIIDPIGNFVTNKAQQHKAIGSLLNENLEDLIIKAELVLATFSKRYKEKGRVIV